MILLIENGPYSQITMVSAQKNCSDQVVIQPTDNATEYLEANSTLTDPVFLIRGNTSVKIITSEFEKIVMAEINSLVYYKLGKVHVGAYMKSGYEKAYVAAGFPDYATTFDYDIMLIDPVEYCDHKHTDILELKKQNKVDLLPLTLNAKDDPIMLEIAEPWNMLTHNVWASSTAGVINMSLGLICKDDVDSAVMFPFDLLHQYTDGTGLAIESIVKHKADTSLKLFGKIKQKLMEERCLKKTN
jgi:hypothetical protein